MKLSARTYAAQWDLHGWIGVVFAIPLFVAFFCGAFALFHHELAVWQEPALHLAGEPPSTAVLQSLASRIEADPQVPRDVDLGFELPHDTRHVRVSVGAGEDAQAYWVDPEGGELVRPRSKLADALHGLHFLQPLPLVGMELSGVAAIALLVAACGGVLLSLGRLRHSVWRFRPQLRRRWWAADAHKSLGLLALPFILVMAWSGATLSLGNVMGAALAEAAFDGSLAAVQTVRGYGGAPPGRSGEAGDALPLAELVERAQRSVGTDEPPHYVGIVLRGDAAAWAFVFFESDLRAPWRYVFVRARDGDVLLDTSHDRTPTRVLEEPLYALHFAWFGGELARGCYVVLAFAVCGLIVVGQLIWIDRRGGRSRRSAVVARGTVGVCVGLVLAVACYFALNRWLPDPIDGRAELEWCGFVTAWGVALLLAIVVPRRPGTLAARYLIAAAVLDLAVVGADASTLSLHALAMPAVARIEVLLLVLGLATAAAAWLIVRAQAREGG